VGLNPLQYSYHFLKINSVVLNSERKICDWCFPIFISEPLITLQTILLHHSVSVNWLRNSFPLRRCLFIICIFYLLGTFVCMGILFGWRNQEDWDGWGTWRGWEKEESNTGFWCRNIKESNHVNDWRIILNWKFKKYDGRTGLICFRIATSGELWWRRLSALSFYWKLDISWLRNV